jgi:hypothetical protein
MNFKKILKNTLYKSLDSFFLLNCAISGKSKRLLFDHIPKTGGTGIHLYLRSHYPESRILQMSLKEAWDTVNEFKGLSQRERDRFYLIHGHYANELIDLVHPETLFITIFRDPTDRVISNYRYILEQPTHYWHRHVVGKKMDVVEFCQDRTISEAWNYLTSHYTHLPLEEIARNPERAARLAFDHLKGKFHFIGFLDELDFFMPIVARKMNFRKKFINRRVNSSKPFSSDCVISQDARQIISEVNAADHILYRLAKEEWSLSGKFETLPQAEAGH